MEVQVGPSLVSIHHDDQFLVCEPNGRMSREQGQGYFVADTRLASGYRLKLEGLAPTLLNSSAVRSHSARFEFTNPSLETVRGTIGPGTLHLRLDRVICHGVHEDYDLVNHGRRPVEVVLEVSVECDFADLFDVKSQRLPRRGSVQSKWDERRRRLTTRYRNGEFQRALALQVVDEDSPPEFANGGCSFRVVLEPGSAWHTCLLWMPELEAGRTLRPLRPCSSLLEAEPARERARRDWLGETTKLATSDPGVNEVLAQAVEDLAGLRMHRYDETAARAAGDPYRWIPAAGVPWFVALFGRDSLIVSLQTLALSPQVALGSLGALAAFQADSHDPERDMEPGKIPHELRHGELASLRLIPHTPYYGTHDATTLYVLTAAQTWRWLGDPAGLDSVRPHVERALAWIDTDGDRDGDGLQEYATRASEGGYYNQGWKDSGGAIVDADGVLAQLPIALCEHQGYVVAAKRAWAQTLEEAYGERRAATRLRSQADRLAEQIERRFWWEAEGTYYLGLDGRKAPIASVASNPGHLLWAEAIVPERARSVAARLLKDDMWSGWGIRTLSNRHPAYWPFSYQCGSVWPHDNAIIAAGLRRYGLDEEAARVARAIFDAAQRFQSRRLPELFAGLHRDEGGFPVQYLGANVPQAWAAGAVVQLLEALLGLEPDAAGKSLRLRPALPAWLSSVAIENLTLGASSVDLEVQRRSDGTHTLELTRRTGALEVELVSS
ncbi:MAG: amylo-alpha-1,6-glucosidase [Gaiellaceae bacterium]